MSEASKISTIGSFVNEYQFLFNLPGVTKYSIFKAVRANTHVREVLARALIALPEIAAAVLSAKSTTYPAKSYSGLLGLPNITEALVQRAIRYNAAVRAALRPVLESFPEIANLIQPEISTSFKIPILTCIKGHKQTSKNTYTYLDGEGTRVRVCCNCENIEKARQKLAASRTWTKKTEAVKLLAEWDDTRSPEQVSASQKVQFKCALGHVWRALISSRLPCKGRAKGRGCPYCAKTGPAKSQSLWTCWTKNPKASAVLALWADQRQPQDVASKDTTALWRCDQGHTYNRAPWIQFGKTRNYCPICSGYTRSRSGPTKNITCSRGHLWAENKVGYFNKKTKRVQNYCRMCRAEHDAARNKRKLVEYAQPTISSKPVRNRGLKVSNRTLAAELMSFFEKEHVDADQD